MYDSIGQPGEDIKDCMLVCGQNVAQVGAVEDILESGEDADPDGRAVVGGDVSGAEVSSFCEFTCWIRKMIRTCSSRRGTAR